MHISQVSDRALLFMDAQVALPLQACLKSFLTAECSSHEHVAVLGTKLALHGIDTLRLFGYGYSADEVASIDSDLAALHATAEAQLSRSAARQGRLLADSPGAPQLHMVKKRPLMPPLARIVLPVQPVAVPTLPSRSRAVKDSKKRDCEKTVRAADKLADIFLQVNSASSLWDTYCSFPSSQLQKQWLASLRDHMADFDHRGLTQVSNTWSKWCEWCNANGRNLARPNALDISGFVKACSRARSSAVSVKNKLRFLEIHLGFRLCTTDVAVRQIVQALPTKSKDRPVLSPRDVLTVWCWARSKNKIVSFFAKFCLLMIFGSVRFRHAQRSTFLAMTSEGAIFEAYRGKSRQADSAALPFHWYVPLLRFCENKMGNVLAKFVEEWKSVAGSSSYLMPGVAGNSLFQASEWTHGDMSAGQFCCFLNELVSAVPVARWPKRDGPTVGARACRRVMATVAHAIRMPMPERYPLGNWTAPEGTRGSAQMVRVCFRYGSEKAEAAFRAKAQGSKRVEDAMGVLAKAGEDVNEIIQGSTWTSLCGSRKRKASSDSSSASSSQSSSSGASSSTVAWLISGNGQLHRRDGPSTTQCGLSCKQPQTGRGKVEAKKRFPNGKWCRKCALDICLHMEAEE